MKLLTISAAAALFLSALPAPAQSPTPAPKPQKVVIEIYRVAPGQHEEFMRLIALFDEANRRAGLPPRQLFVHQDGAGWDFLFIQPADVPPEKEAALDRAYKELKTPSGANFFVTIRKFIAEHEDTFASGPTTAADWLKSLDEAKARSR